jgi:1-acyl-sn-glycerol-3-phosphate acyltransferase
MDRTSNPAYAAYCVVVFGAMAGVVLLVNLFVPSLRGRRRVARAGSRFFLWAAAVDFRVEGLDRLPSSPCVVVANHASYLDGLVMAAALPPDFGFVVKKEMIRVPLAGVLLRRMGCEFVERFNRHQGAIDTRRVMRRAADGQSMVFFPEGTFRRERVVGPFHGGAFTIAARSNCPLVPAAITGTRKVLPAGTLRMHRAPVTVRILDILPAPQDLDQAAVCKSAALAIIAAAVGEPAVGA